MIVTTTGMRLFFIVATCFFTLSVQQTSNRAALNTFYNTPSQNGLDRGNLFNDIPNNEYSSPRQNEVSVNDRNSQNGRFTSGNRNDFELNELSQSNKPTNSYVAPRVNDATKNNEFNGVSRANESPRKTYEAPMQKEVQTKLEERTSPASNYNAPRSNGQTSSNRFNVPSTQQQSSPNRYDTTRKNGGSEQPRKAFNGRRQSDAQVNNGNRLPSNNYIAPNQNGGQAENGIQGASENARFDGGDQSVRIPSNSYSSPARNNEARVSDTRNKFTVKNEKNGNSINRNGVQRNTKSNGSFRSNGSQPNRYNAPRQNEVPRNNGLLENTRISNDDSLRNENLNNKYGTPENSFDSNTLQSSNRNRMNRPTTIRQNEVQRINEISLGNDFGSSRTAHVSRTNENSQLNRSPVSSYKAPEEFDSVNAAQQIGVVDSFGQNQFNEGSSNGQYDTQEFNSSEDESVNFETNIPGGGVAGEDYPILANVPDTEFTCEEQEFPGYYADTNDQAGCQVFHICHRKNEIELQKDSFLCPNGSLFNQQYFVCDWWFNVNCSESDQFYQLNQFIGEASESRFNNENDGQIGGYESVRDQSRNGYSQNNQSGRDQTGSSVGNGNGNLDVDSYAQQSVEQDRNGRYY